MLVCTDIHNVLLALGQIGLKELSKLYVDTNAVPKTFNFPRWSFSQKYLVHLKQCQQRKAQEEKRLLLDQVDQVDQVRKIEIKLVEQEKKQRWREVDSGQPSVSREIKRKSSQEAVKEVERQMMETGDHLERMRDSMRPVRGGCVEKW